MFSKYSDEHPIRIVDHNNKINPFNDERYSLFTNTLLIGNEFRVSLNKKWP
jgi:hypothetical protein